jgi:sec-independent protein translocase protein TatC
MATRLKPIAHEDRLSLVEHLDELRTRVVVCVIAFVVAAGFCLWQEDVILRTVNEPLADVANKKPCDETRDPLEQADCSQQAQKRVNARIAATAEALARSAGDDPACAGRRRTSRRWRPRLSPRHRPSRRSGR